MVDIVLFTTLPIIFVFIQHQIRQMKCQKCFLFCLDCYLSFMVIYGTLVILFSVAKYYLPKPANRRSDNQCTLNHKHMFVAKQQSINILEQGSTN